MLRSSEDHNRILRDAARESLMPLGLRQKGRSRVWIDDRLWYIIVVEFQPSGFSKGSYLNVGAMWLWSLPKPYLSFDYGNRVADFQSAKEDDWPQRCASLARAAAGRVLEIRQEIGDPVDVARRLTAAVPASGWPRLHAGIALGLAGDREDGRSLLGDVLHGQPRTDWQRELAGHAMKLRDALADTVRFRASVVDAIQASREALRLPAVAEDSLITAVDQPST